MDGNWLFKLTLIGLLSASILVYLLKKVLEKTKTGIIPRPSLPPISKPLKELSLLVTSGASPIPRLESKEQQVKAICPHGAAGQAKRPFSNWFKPSSHSSFAKRTISAWFTLSSHLTFTSDRSTGMLGHHASYGEKDENSCSSNFSGAIPPSMRLTMISVDSIQAAMAMNELRGLEQRDRFLREFSLSIVSARLTKLSSPYYLHLEDFFEESWSVPAPSPQIAHGEVI